MIAAITVAATPTAAGVLPVNAAPTASPAARIDPMRLASETYRVTTMMRIITGRTINAQGNMPMIAPAPVATPFPPLKPMYGDQQCPATAAIATAAIVHDVASDH